MNMERKGPKIYFKSQEIEQAHKAFISEFLKNGDILGDITTRGEV